MVAVAEGAARLKRATKHLEEAQGMQLKAVEMHATAMEELELAKQADTQCSSTAASSPRYFHR